LGGLNPSFFVIWGGLAPPSPYVEPPLVHWLILRAVAHCFAQICFFYFSPRHLLLWSLVYFL